MAANTLRVRIKIKQQQKLYLLYVKPNVKVLLVNLHVLVRKKLDLNNFSTEDQLHSGKS